MQEYMTLNDDFEHRLKDKNRYQNKKETGDKRPIFDSPKKSETSGSESEEEEEIKPYVIKPEKGECSTEAKNQKTQKMKKKKKRNNRK
ncbi:unnamed protein product [Rhizophagus irregularis]|nr:unnamed protein product [Rhizophagus irregularis]